MKLSVAIITYDHEAYISQALDSVLMQEVDFDYEIVVGDDLSNDHTRDILLEYQKKYPNKIHLIFHEDRMGPGGNIYHVLNACRGEFIALLEGDDFWLDAHKLKKQVTFLEENQHFALTCHPMIVYSQEFDLYQRPVGVVANEVNTLHDLLSQKGFPQIGSVVYRNKFRFPPWLTDLRYCDYAIVVLIAHHGLLKFYKDVMGCYRRHDQGVWTGETSINRMKNNIIQFELLNKVYNYQYEKYFNVRVLYGALAAAYQEAGKSTEAKQAFKLFLRLPHGGKVNVLFLLRTIIAVFFPMLLKIYRILRDKFWTMKKVIMTNLNLDKAH